MRENAKPAASARATFARVAVFAGAVLTLVGCTGSAATPPEGAEPGIGPVPAMLASVDLRLPVEDYLLGTAATAKYAKAGLVLVQRCMRGFGLDYPVDTVSGMDYGPRSITDRRYGITDAALAKVHGYGLGDRDPSRQPRPATPNLGPEGQTVLLGQGTSTVNGKQVPAGGCVGEANRHLDRLVSSGANPQLGQLLNKESFEATRKDSRVRAAFTAWSACMAKADLHYADPLAAVSDPKFGTPANAEQIAVAETDIRCKQSANVVGVWFTVESAYQKRRIERDQAAFTATRQALEARERAANEIVPGV